MTTHQVTEKFSCGYDKDLAIKVGEILTKWYPGYQWMVGIQDHNVIIRNAETIQYGWCYFINRKDLAVDTYDSFMRRVIMFGGEFLERGNVTIGAKKEGDKFGILAETEGKHAHVMSQFYQPGMEVKVVTR